MKQLVIELDDDTAEKLEAIAPARTRRRSQFIRDAIRQAIWALEERATAKAYRRQPDSDEDAYVDSRVWEKAEARPKLPNSTSESSE